MEEAMHEAASEVPFFRHAAAHHDPDGRRTPPPDAAALDDGTDGHAAAAEAPIPYDPQAGPAVRVRNAHGNVGTVAGAAHTGPKGVLRDYQESRRPQQVEQVVEEQPRQPAPWAATNTGNNLNANGEEEDEDDEGFDSEEERLLRTMLAARMQKAQAQQVQHGLGQLNFIEQDAFVATIDGAPPGMAVLIHLYEENMESCVRFNAILRDLAAAHCATKFAAIIASKAKKSFDPIGLPALLIYRGGEQQHAFLRVHEMVAEATGSDRFDTERVSTWLQQHNVL